jgi:hypothetical protein
VARLHGAALLLLLFAAGCCTTLSTAPSATVPGEPAVVIRGIKAGWFVLVPSSIRPREHETWEIRIWPDGTVQEARGWRGEEGVLPRRNIGLSAARQILEETRPLATLPLWVGEYATDTPYHEIEIASGVGRQIIMAFRPDAPTAETELFDRIWTSLIRRFPETAVCSQSKSRPARRAHPGSGGP